jgi:ribosomal-protein-alanine N-acetyltransferase
MIYYYQGGEKMDHYIMTPRLRLIPCLPERLEEKRDAETDLHLKNAYGQMLDECRNHPSEWVWFTDWDILLRETGEVVGGAGFKGAPDDRGQVEIGYGISEPFRRRGYMSEALEGLCQWAFRQERIRLILSEVEYGNDSSVKTLLKNGFVETLPRENRWFQKVKP